MSEGSPVKTVLRISVAAAVVSRRKQDRRPARNERIPASLLLLSLQAVLWMATISEGDAFSRSLVCQSYMPTTERCSVRRFLWEGEGQDPVTSNTTEAMRDVIASFEDNTIYRTAGNNWVAQREQEFRELRRISSRSKARNMIPEEDADVDEADSRLNSLAPPSVNFERTSILFDEKPATQRDNASLRFWRRTKDVLPPVVTGAWPWRPAYVAEQNPVGALYNMIIVRIPVVLVAIVYTRNIILQDVPPLVVDIGGGPFQLPALIVYLVLGLILL